MNLFQKYDLLFNWRNSNIILQVECVVQVSLLHNVTEGVLKTSNENLASLILLVTLLLTKSRQFGLD